MNMATRCTACGTMFRVVQDQLKVSDGWVRCGRCQAVFNAQERLFDLEHDTPPPWQAPPEMPDSDLVSEPADNDLAATASFAPDDADETPVSEAQGAALPAWTQIEPPVSMSTSESAERDADGQEAEAHEAADTDTEPVLEDSASNDALATDTALVVSGNVGAAPTADGPTSPTSEDDAVPEFTPAFLQQARRSERWQQPPVRRMLWALVAASALLLGAQVTHHFRQVIAAQHPGALPWLQSFCAVARCRIDILRRIADVSIESTALTQGLAPAQTQALDDAAVAPDSDAHILRLALTLRNRGEWAIAMPSVDLSLTGSDGELVARRSLSPPDFGVGDPRLIPGLDTPLSLRFRVAGGRVSGYTVEVFYP